MHDGFKDNLVAFNGLFIGRHNGKLKAKRAGLKLGNLGTYIVDERAKDEVVSSLGRNRLAFVVGNRLSCARVNEIE